LAEAKLPVGKTLDSFDFDAVPMISKAQVSLRQMEQRVEARFRRWAKASVWERIMAARRAMCCDCSTPPGRCTSRPRLRVLIADLQAQNIIGDKAFDSDRFRAHVAQRNMTAVIPSNASRSRAIPHDPDLYKERHLVECFISKIKHFRRVATRYDKTIASYASFVAVAAFMVCMR
jgi:putative transposase